MGVFGVSTGLMIIAIICLNSSTVADVVLECEGLDEIDCPTQCDYPSCEWYLENGEPDEAYCAAQMTTCLAQKTCGCLEGTYGQWMGQYSLCIPKEECGCLVEDEYVKLDNTFVKADGTTCKCEQGHQCNAVVGRRPPPGPPRGRR
ncbi:uncharacterized protein LOC117306646 [Asterias rubens]|uniref:uncharacterized protein LOC117306646 n=1 Tax=Asterias rubens TaxID=7604 RepID=UPI0014558B58|nr:uncharacterized protein LOC117306646 [Asterias rubens]